MLVRMEGVAFSLPFLLLYNRRGVGGLCVRPTGQSADHGESGKGAGQPLSTHDGSGVGGGENPCQPKQTALKNGSECWRGHKERRFNMWYTVTVTQNERH